MERLFGLLFAMIGVAVILIRDRFIEANAAGSKVLFGKWDPYTRAPRAARLYSLVVIFVAGGAFVVVGVLTLLGLMESGS